MRSASNVTIHTIANIVMIMRRAGSYRVQKFVQVIEKRSSNLCEFEKVRTIGERKGKIFLNSQNVIIHWTKKR